ncbi:hypothetical protein BV917_06625 [Leptospira santarosai serovar Guaricura]|nr:hypothetical protein BV917_06625 [Leptospira santarosai serovar Guaricura]
MEYSASFMSFPKKTEKNASIFRFHSQIPEILVIQVPTFSFQNSEISENFAFLHIFQIYEQQSCSLLTSNSYLASIHRFKPLFSLSLTSKSLLGLTQVPDKSQTSPIWKLQVPHKYRTGSKQVPFGIRWTQTEPEQDSFGIR